MTKFEESVRSMYIAVRDYLLAESAVWGGSAGMTNGVNLLSTHIDNIDAYSVLQQADTKGITRTKRNKQAVLIGKIMKVANGLSAYGYATGDLTIAGQAKVTKTSLTKLPDTLLTDKAHSILLHGNAHIAALADYNILPADITALQNASVDFTQEMQKPKNALGSKKTGTANLKNTFVETTLHLVHVLDPLVRTYNETHPAFVLAYSNNREIFDTGKQKLAVQFRVHENIDHLPLGNVQIFITPGDFVKRTTAKGNAQMQSLKTGSYNAVFSKAGFVTLSVPFYVNAGEMTKVAVEMRAV